MLFNSLEFMFFLPIVFILYWFVFNKNLRFQNAFIVAVSYIFYGWWDWRFLVLIGFTSLCSFVSGLLIERYSHPSDVAKRRVVNGLNIAINLIILGVFKYYNFFVGEIAQIFGADTNSLLINVILPVGISFYTFQALSYSIDVYRGTIKPANDIIELFAYVSFFPQLVAGPIERASNLLPQFAKKRTFSYELAIDGMRQMLWGFFKKVLIADVCAIGVNSIFANYTEVGAMTLIFGALLFTLQIYGDFSGYSDIAIGCSKLFGITLMRNFNVPYLSRDMAEFWRRWHISLTTWFRDYIYIPLGGSRTTKLLSIRNTFIIFLVSGFWHGANWTYIAWGLYHAILFIPLLLFGTNRNHKEVVAKDGIFLGLTLKDAGQIVITFILVTIGWIIFRAESIGQAFDYIYRIFTEPFIAGSKLTHYLPMRSLCILAYAVPALMITEWLTRSKNHGFDFSSNSIFKYKALRVALYYVFIVWILYNATGGANTFIYFQF